MQAQPLRLTPPVPPLELRRPLAHDQAMTHAMREAMKAALAGDFRQLDTLEIAYVNLLVRIGELQVRRRDGAPHWWFDARDLRNRQLNPDEDAPFVTAIYRGFGPYAETALEWCVGEKCRRCAHLLRHVDCRVCGGTWHLIDVPDQVLYTDMDGFLLEERA
jgi:hypothetical protein